VALLTVIGCSHHHLPSSPVAVGPTVAAENPIFVPAVDREFLWLQIVDTTDDYFRIVREDRVRVVGGVLTEGRIATAPTVGATYLEPWRRDSTPGFERLESSLQSIRRRAEVRVMPVADGYTVEVAVFKELEDVSRPEHATVGSATLRHDGSLVRTTSDPDTLPITLGWIPLGRDPSLELQILSEIRGRLGL
jgi:hypothetical protein